MGDETIWTTYVIPIASGVLPILLAGAGALLRVCRRFDRVEQQNVFQSQQLASLAAAVERLQVWALGRSGQGEGH